MKPWAAFHFEKDEAKKAELKQKWLAEQLPPFLKQFEKKVTENKSGFLVGDGPTWADFVVVTSFEMLTGLDANILDAYPGLKTYNQKVRDLKGEQVEKDELEIRDR